MLSAIPTCRQYAIRVIPLVRFLVNSLAVACFSAFLTLAIALPATILTGMLSYRFLESPFLRFKKRFTFVRSRPL